MTCRSLQITGIWYCIVSSFSQTFFISSTNLQFLQIWDKESTVSEPAHKMACAPREDSDQPGHPPSLIRVFAVRMKKPWALSYPLSTQQRLIRLGKCPVWSESLLSAWRNLGPLATHWAHSKDWLDWADAQADLRLRCPHEETLDP